MSKTAIIIGATGLTGGLLLQKFLDDDRYDKVKIFSRRSIEISHPKIIEFLGDIIELDSFSSEFTGDEVYCCIGTTAKVTPDKSLYKKIDFGIPVKAAQLCVKNKIKTYLIVSALGADANSSIFYNRTKGEMEEAVLKENILNTYILRPSLILGQRNENRLAENIGKAMFKSFQFVLLGKLKKYKAIEADAIAQAMIYLANKKPKVNIIESDKINELASLEYY